MSLTPDFPPEGYDNQAGPPVELVTWVATPKELKLWVRIKPFEIVAVYAKQGPDGDELDEHGTWRHDVYNRWTGEPDGNAGLRILPVIDMLEALVAADPALRALNDTYYGRKETF